MAAAALVVGLVGGLAGAAQAQQRDGVNAHTQVMPRHDGREIEAVQPATRDMGTSQTAKAKPQGVAGGCQQEWWFIDGYGVNLRSTPWGEIKAHANAGDNIYFLEYSDDGQWAMINDYTANGWGVWIYTQYLGHDENTCW
ncbi:hypothetical protein KUTG_10083 [Kutzneria sp. 744]|nr:hypothetical protein KUTG_10083 [Kutzneria sp. 744]